MIINFRDQSTPQKSIALQTRCSTDIANSQTTQIDLEESLAIMKKYELRYVGIILRPNTISGYYNCHGMTFASRRTGIDSITPNIIPEDNYIELKPNQVLPGDIVFYISETNEIEHSGMVLLGMDKFNPSLMSIQILSKWGEGSEVIHPLYACPYGFNNIKFFRCEN